VRPGGKGRRGAADSRPDRGDAPRRRLRALGPTAGHRCPGPAAPARGPRIEGCSMRASLERWRTPGCGISSVALFAVHALAHGPLPARGASATQLLRYASRHYAALLASAWLDGLATALLVLLIAGILGLAARPAVAAAAVTVAGVGVIASLILLNDVFFVTLAQAGRDGQAASALIAWRLVVAINLVFPVANMLWLTGLAALLLRPPGVPRGLAYPRPAPRVAWGGGGPTALPP